MTHPTIMRPWYEALPTMSLPGNRKQIESVLRLADFDHVATERSRKGRTWQAWTKEGSNGDNVLAGLENRNTRLFILMNYTGTGPREDLITMVHSYFDAREKLQAFDWNHAYKLGRFLDREKYNQIVQDHFPVLTLERGERIFLPGQEALKYVVSRIPIREA